MNLLNSGNIELAIEPIFRIIESGDAHSITQMMNKIEIIGRENSSSIKILLPKFFDAFQRANHDIKVIIRKTLENIPYEETFSNKEIFSLLELDMASINLLEIISNGITVETELHIHTGLSSLEFSKKIKYLLSEGLIMQEWSGFTKLYRINDNDIILEKLRSAYINQPIPIP